MGYALAILDRIRTDVEERFRFQTQALQTGCQEGEEFGRNPQMQNLLGQTRYLWEWNIALQLQVHALTEEQEELIRRQTTSLETTLGLHNKGGRDKTGERPSAAAAGRLASQAPSDSHTPSFCCLRGPTDSPGVEGSG